MACDSIVERTELGGKHEAACGSLHALNSPSFSGVAWCLVFMRLATEPGADAFCVLSHGWARKY